MLVDPWFVGDLIFMDQEWLYRGIKRDVGKTFKPDLQQIAQQTDVLVLTQVSRHGKAWHATLRTVKMAQWALAEGCWCHTRLWLPSGASGSIGGDGPWVTDHLLTTVRWGCWGHDHDGFTHLMALA